MVSIRMWVCMHVFVCVTNLAVGKGGGGPDEEEKEKNYRKKDI